MNWQAALAAQKTSLGLACMRDSAGRCQGRWFCPSALHLDLRRTTLSSQVPGTGGQKPGPEETMEMVRGLEHFSCEDRLREVVIKAQMT